MHAHARIAALINTRNDPILAQNPSRPNVTEERERSGRTCLLGSCGVQRNALLQPRE